MSCERGAWEQQEEAEDRTLHFMGREKEGILGRRQAVGSLGDGRKTREGGHGHQRETLTTTVTSLFFFMIKLKLRELNESHRSPSLSVAGQACGRSQQP